MTTHDKLESAAIDFAREQGITVEQARVALRLALRDLAVRTGKMTANEAVDSFFAR